MPASSVQTAADLMSAPVVDAPPDEPVSAIAASMRDRRVGSVVIADAGRVIGILTERDLVRLAAAGADPASTKASEWMTQDPHTVAPDEPIEHVLRLFAERGYRHAPVVDAGRLVGIVSMRDVMRVAHIRPVETPAADIPAGLKGVVVAETSVGDVRGAEGFFHYREHDAIGLAARCSLEDVWYLLHRGALPGAEERAAFAADVASLRVVPEDVLAILPEIAVIGGEDVLAALRAAVALVGSSLGFKPSLDHTLDEIGRQALRLGAVLPTLAAAIFRLQAGHQPVEPDRAAGHAADYLRMLTGSPPDPARARALEQYLILTADHGLNASTFTARVIASTRADLSAAVSGAIGALSGPLHGGAPSRALDMLDEIDEPGNADAWLRAHLERGGRLMGFGHAVYRTEDPRSRLLRSIAEQLGGDRIVLAMHVEERALAILRELRPGRELYTNVEFYAAVVLEATGVPPEMFTATFAISRVLGWTAHILEQTADNRIIRPSARYVGHDPVPAGPRNGTRGAHAPNGPIWS